MAESEGPAATSTIILSPLCGEKATGDVSITHSNRDGRLMNNLKTALTYVCQEGRDKYEENIVDEKD